MIPGVWVTGHVRSGTSMIAGLFREHGVFFGECGGPVGDNRKGRVEHVWLKAELHASRFDNLRQRFFAKIEAEGWISEIPWGVKFMPKWGAHIIPQLRPSVLVLCYRPEKDILASCARVGWARDRSLDTIRDRWRLMEVAAQVFPGTVVRVDTPRVAQGDIRQLLPAFAALNLMPDPAAFDRWVDPTMFHA